MKIGFYNPYLNTLGGGEKYFFDLIKCLEQENEIDIFWDESSVLKQAEERFGKDFGKVNFVQNIFSGSFSFLSKYNKTSQYDRIVYLSDGSIPFLFAKKNILIFQFPIPWVKKNLFSSIKFNNIDAVICYSSFVKEHLDRTLKVSSKILPPLVEKTKVKADKENLILSVGRFTKAMNRKKQELLIDVFKEMVDEGLENWRLVLAGSVLEDDLDFVERLDTAAQGFPIEIITNAKRQNLLEYYAKAKIYWHAAGFGEDLVKHPEFAEHFGITTVEAMGAGAVPVVFGAGGQKEIVENGTNGFFWNSKEELKRITTNLIVNEDKLKSISIESEKRANDFNSDNFCKKAKEIILS
jgi:glycosyltransferase involved in cell wall biosynthesis